MAQSVASPDKRTRHGDPDDAPPSPKAARSAEEERSPESTTPAVKKTKLVRMRAPFFSVERSRFQVRETTSVSYPSLWAPRGCPLKPIGWDRIRQLSLKVSCRTGFQGAGQCYSISYGGRKRLQPDFATEEEAVVAAKEWLAEERARQGLPP